MRFMKPVCYPVSSCAPRRLHVVGWLARLIVRWLARLLVVRSSSSGPRRRLHVVGWLAGLLACTPCRRQLACTPRCPLAGASRCRVLVVGFVVGSSSAPRRLLVGSSSAP